MLELTYRTVMLGEAEGGNMGPQHTHARQLRSTHCFKESDISMYLGDEERRAGRAKRDSVFHPRPNRAVKYSWRLEGSQPPASGSAHQ